MNLLKSLFANVGLPCTHGVFAVKPTSTPPPIPTLTDAVTPAPAPSTTTWDVEYTDTFGGQANYSWVTRSMFTMPSDATDRSVIIRAKKEIGMSGVKCDREDMGESIKLTPRGTCTAIFVTPRF